MQQSKNRLVNSTFSTQEEYELEIQGQVGNVKREKWANKWDFFFSALGWHVGLSNVWRFPYMCYKNGGGAFLIPYYIGVIVAAMPMFFLETLIGQYTSQGGPNTWKIVPVFKGIGFAGALLAFFSNIYYIVLMAWSTYFLYASFTSVLPWATCDNKWNTANCITPFDHKSINSSLQMSHLKSSAEEFWEYNVLQSTSSIDQIGDIRWELLICLALCWIAVYFCIFKGSNWTGKVAYFTSTFPLVVMFIMLIRGLTLESAWVGVKYLFTPDWVKIKHTQVWFDAFTQSLYSYGSGMGGMTVLGSYNRFKHNCYNEMIALTIIRELTGIVSGIIIFSVLGYMTSVTGQSIEEVATGGPGLAFIAYPNALTQLPLSPIWSVLFFLMLLFVALDGEFVCVEGFITACTDIFPKLRKIRKTFVFLVCLFSFFIGIIFVTQGGIYWFEIINVLVVAGWAILTVTFFECITISYGYGANKFYANTKEMLGFYPGLFWKYCWMFVTPGVCLILFVFSILKIERLTLKDYVYPWWAEIFGWCLALSSIVCIPVYATYKVIVNRNDLRKLVTPEPIAD